MKQLLEILAYISLCLIIIVIILGTVLTFSGII